MTAEQERSLEPSRGHQRLALNSTAIKTGSTAGVDSPFWSDVTEDALTHEDPQSALTRPYSDEKNEEKSVVEIEECGSTVHNHPPAFTTDNDREETYEDSESTSESMKPMNTGVGDVKERIDIANRKNEANDPGDETSAEVYVS